MLLLGIDIGTSGAKAVVVDSERTGAVLGVGAADYPLHTPRPLWAEEDPEDWWKATVTCIRQAAQRSGVDARSIAAVGLSGQMQGAVLLDSSDRVIRNAPLWCDQRAASEAAGAAARIGQARVVELTCNPILMGSTASKLLWLRKCEPESYARIARVLLPKDYVRLRMTGEHATDVCDASATALFDVAARAWSNEMLEALEIPAAWLPSALESAEVSGRIRPQAAAETGLAPGTIVAAGAGDDASAAVGCGAVSAGIIGSSLGTSAVLLGVSAQAVPDALMRVDMFCHAIPQRWQIIGATLAAGASLRWFKNAFCEAEQTAATQAGTDVYDALCREALTTPPGSEGLIFLPHLSGMRTPEPNPNATGVFFGITLRHRKPHFLRAILEGVAFGVRDSIEIFKELGVPVDEVRSIGGGSRSEIWRQIQADVIGLPHCAVNVTECAAFGAALLAGVSASTYPSVPEACQATIKPLGTFAPAAENAEVYDRNCRQYRALVQSVYRHRPS